MSAGYGQLRVKTGKALAEQYISVAHPATDVGVLVEQWLDAK